MTHAPKRDLANRAQPAGARYAFVVGLLLAAVATTCRGLDPSRSMDQYRCVNWSRQNGLPVSSVNALVQSIDGYLWLGTQQGLVRFDGKEFTSFPVPHTAVFVSQNISSLAASRRGGVWFGLRKSSAGYFDGSHFSAVNAPWIEPNMQVSSVTEASDGSLWAAWNFGYGRARPDGKAAAADEQLVGTRSFRLVATDPSKRTWVAAADPGALYYWADGQRHTVADESIHNLEIAALVEDRDGNVWLGTQYGLRAFDSQLRAMAIPGYDRPAAINALLVDHAGVLWIGTEGEGLLRYAQGQFTRFTTTDGLVNDAVTALCEDTEGNLWIGTRGGLTQLSDVKFVLYGAREGLPAEPLGVAAAGDSVLIATARGLSRLSNNTVTTVDLNLANTYLKRVWQATNGDVYVLDGQRGVAIFRDGKPLKRYELKEWPVALAEDSRGMLGSFGPELYRF